MDHVVVVVGPPRIAGDAALPKTDWERLGRLVRQSEHQQTADPVQNAAGMLVRLGTIRQITHLASETTFEPIPKMRDSLGRNRRAGAS